jgi:hypothetical protein
MGKIILVFLLALIPLLLGFWLIRQSKQRFQARMRRMRRLQVREVMSNSSDYLESSERYQDYIGELSCRFNAHSPYLRCAVNPAGPCENCPYYQPLN